MSIRSVLSRASAAALFIVFSAPVETPAGLCPPPDPETCLERCYRHKRECYGTCKERKRQCIAGARLEAKACRLECRSEDSVEDVGRCRRRCVAEGLRTAVYECKLGRPVCMKECNPHACPRRCDALLDDATRTCERPGDLECLGECAREFRRCLHAVREDGRDCASSCSEYRDEDRRRCLRACAEKTHEGAARCVGAFRDCAGGCFDDAASDERAATD